MYVLVFECCLHVFFLFVMYAMKIHFHVLKIMTLNDHMQFKIICHKLNYSGKLRKITAALITYLYIIVQIIQEF